MVRRGKRAKKMSCIAEAYRLAENQDTIQVCPFSVRGVLPKGVK